MVFPVSCVIVLCSQSFCNFHTVRVPPVIALGKAIAEGIVFNFCDLGISNVLCKCCTVV